MFLHLRDAGDDFLALMRKHRSAIVGGVVHSFDGSAELAAELVGLDLSIGINGCSLREASVCTAHTCCWLGLLVVLCSGATQCFVQ